MIEVRQPTFGDLAALEDILEAEQLGCDTEGLPCWVAAESNVDHEVLGGVIANFAYGDYGSKVPPGHGRDHAFVHAIAVASEHRRKGVGRALMRRVAEGAHSAGLSFLVLMPQEREADAAEHIAFFRTCGLNSLAPGSYLAAYGAPVSEILQRLQMGS
ncbi:GNAT family N-acetyltransferase [Micromonospora sp. WMMD723]|uniref:GNAT family N-acetyltransferase n=1 Tax=Micromonospora sp. WMMD723 TaxID=3403465 RepID=UPI003CED6354